MQDNQFQARQPSINANPMLRTPQHETYAALEIFAGTAGDEREAGIVLPVGCGKWGVSRSHPSRSVQAERAARHFVPHRAFSINGRSQLNAVLAGTQQDVVIVDCARLCWVLSETYGARYTRGGRPRVACQIART